MSKRNIIVVGASAGGVTALAHFASKLPENFKGTVFVVLHVPAKAASILPSILSNAGPLPAIHPKDGEKMEEGKIYVAPNNYYLLANTKRANIIHEFLLQQDSANGGTALPGD